MIDLEIVQTRAAIEYPVYKEKSEQDVQHVVLRYLDGKWHLAGLEDIAQSLDIRCQKCTDLCSNYYRSELKMCVSCTEWPRKSSHQVQDSYDDIEYKQLTNVLFDASRHVRTAIRISQAEWALA